MSALDISPEEFHSLATRVTGLATRFLAALPALPSYPGVSGQQSRERFAELYRSAGAARAAFSHTGDYARTFGSDPTEAFAFFEESMELSRRFRALKLWLSLRYHGVEAFRAAIRCDLRHAADLTRIIRETADLELLAPAELSAVCFRYRAAVPDGELDRVNAAILKRLIERGRMYLSNASIAGHFALRACFVNHRTTDSDVSEIVPEVLAASRDVLGA